MLDQVLGDAFREGVYYLQYEYLLQIIHESSAQIGLNSYGPAQLISHNHKHPLISLLLRDPSPSLQQHLRHVCAQLEEHCYYSVKCTYRYRVHDGLLSDTSLTT